MKPVFDLTVDEAVAELEQVCDQLMDAPDPKSKNLTTRKTELQAWILMHQGHPKAADPVPTDPAPPEQDEPMPRPRLTDEEKRASKKAQNERHRAKKKAEKHATAMSVGVAATEQALGVKMPAPRVNTPTQRLVETAIDFGAAVEREAAKAKTHTANDELRVSLASLQSDVLKVMTYMVLLEPADRAAYLESAANLDALAHQLAQFLATGRIEVAA